MTDAGYIHHHSTAEETDEAVSSSKVPPLVFEEAKRLEPNEGEIPLVVREAAYKEQASDDHESLCDELPAGRSVTEVVRLSQRDNVSADNSVTEEAATFYTINVDKKTSKHGSLGLEIDRTDDLVLIVVKMGVGFISEWNDANPSKKVELGDIIIKVNGQSGDAKKMVALCRSEDRLEMYIKRPLNSNG